MVDFSDSTDLDLVFTEIDRILPKKSETKEPDTDEEGDLCTERDIIPFPHVVKQSIGSRIATVLQSVFKPNKQELYRIEPGVLGDHLEELETRDR